MATPPTIEKLYPNLGSNPQGNHNLNSLEQQLELRLKEMNSFNNSVNNIKDIKNFYNYETKKYKKLNDRFKLLNNLLQTIDTLIILGVTSTSVTLSVTGVGIIIVPISAGVGGFLGISSKLISEYLKRREKYHLKKYTLSLKTLEDFQKLHSKCLEDSKIDQNEYKKLTETYNKYKDERNKISTTFLGST